jgi:hypothetical protein
MATSNVAKLNGCSFKKPALVVTKTYEPSESRIDDALGRGLLTVRVPESRRRVTVPLLVGPIDEPDARDSVQSAVILPPAIATFSSVDFAVAEDAHVCPVPIPDSDPNAL